MAARLNRRHSEMVLKKIRVGQLLKRLQDHVLGDVEMSKTQIAAAKVLLGKTLADRKAVEHSGEIGQKAPAEMTTQELDERIARLAAREEAPASSAAEPSGIH